MNNDLISRSDIKDHISELMLVYSGTELDNAILNAIDNAETVSDRYDEGFRDGYAQCINDREERKENNRLFQKGENKPLNWLDRCDDDYLSDN